MWSKWKRAVKEYDCVLCGAHILHGMLYVFQQGGHHNYRRVCETCAEEHIAPHRICNVKSSARSRSCSPGPHAALKYRAICPYCRLHKIVSTKDEAHEWMKTHEHGPRYFLKCDGYATKVDPENLIIDTLFDRSLNDPFKAVWAIMASALKWMDILNMPDVAVDMGPNNCPLCETYSQGQCATCPVALWTGKRNCEGSPYIAWRNHHWTVHDQWRDLTVVPGCDECRILANDELNFLLFLSEASDYEQYRNRRVSSCQSAVEIARIFQAVESDAFEDIPRNVMPSRTVPCGTAGTTCSKGGSVPEA